MCVPYDDVTSDYVAFTETFKLCLIFWLQRFRKPLLLSPKYQFCCYGYYHWLATRHETYEKYDTLK